MRTPLYIDAAYEDIAYWNLNAEQRYQYLTRLSAYHYRRYLYHTERSKVYRKRAKIWYRVVLLAAGFFVGGHIVSFIAYLLS